jgi:ketosteroid isomerase-like protein
MKPGEIRELATRFFDAIEKGDIECVRGIYADGARIWHNIDGRESSREDNLRVLEGFIEAVPKRRYTNRKLSVFDSGFVEQHLLIGKLANGKDTSLSACVVCEVENGRITRLDEYFDSAAIATWRG